MEDAHLVKVVAQEMVERHGRNALPRILEMLAVARAAQDALSVGVWSDIADAAKLLLT
jgi:hypothetical protein